MITIRGTSNVVVMLQMYACVAEGREVEARGAKTRNIRDLAIVLNSNHSVLTSFEARKMSLAYAKREWLWYLGADPYDSSIERHATAWAKIKQPDGSYFSNYGQYIFGSPTNLDMASQFEFVVDTLHTDRDTRRASMVLLRPEHLFESNPDVVCTYAINFGIEGDRLDMTVMMRSNDVIFGFTNDAFCFWQLHTFVHAMLSDRYPDLQLGTYTHFTNSMHVYERHYDMIKRIVDGGHKAYTHCAVPTPTRQEVVDLYVKRGDYDGSGAYGTWLKT